MNVFISGEFTKRRTEASSYRKEILHFKFNTFSKTISILFSSIKLNMIFGMKRDYPRAICSLTPSTSSESNHFFALEIGQCQLNKNRERKKVILPIFLEKIVKSC